MACSNPNVIASISAALRACTPCPAAPPSRRMLLVDRVPLARATPGNQITVDLSSIPARDSLGRVGHIRGLYIDAVGSFTLGATNVAKSSYQLRSLFDQFLIQDTTGHMYAPNLEARTLIDDTFFRHWADQQWRYLSAGTQFGAGGAFGPTQTVDYGLAANIGASTVTRQLSVYFPFVTENPEFDPLAGLISVAALQGVGQSTGLIRFRLGSTVKGTATGITFNGVTNGDGQPGLDVWADVVYLPGVSSTPWILDSYTLPQLTGSLPHGEASTEHAWIRFFPEDAANDQGQLLVANLDLFALTTAGFNELSANMVTRATFAKRMDLTYASEPLGALARANAKQDLPIRATPGNDATLLAMMILGYRQAGSGESSGPVIFGVGTNPNQQQTRYVQRVVNCVSGDWHGQIVEASQCNPCGASVCRGLSPKGNGRPQKKGAIYTPVAGVG